MLSKVQGRTTIEIHADEEDLGAEPIESAKWRGGAQWVGQIMAGCYLGGHWS
jgi:hypothetical protein